MEDSQDVPNELALAKKIREMKDDDLVDFIRNTVVRLDALADRLELYADEESPPTTESNSA